MKTGITLMVIAALSLTSCSQQNRSERDRLFNDGWRFTLDTVTGAESPGYDDTSWSAIDLPHDFSILPLPGEDNDDKVGPFSKQSPGGNFTGHVMGGVGWYRKTFALDKADEGKRITLLFDGAFQETDVWVNGHPVGQNKHGYTSFAFDVTDKLNPAGRENVVTVKVSNLGSSSRWYSGSGLYRDVHLLVTDPLHVDLWGAYVTTPAITQSSATVNIEVTICNDTSSDASADVTVSITDKSGKAVAAISDKADVCASSKKVVSGQLSVPNPDMWLPENPSLYTAEITVKSGSKVVDTYCQKFGIRILDFTADKGLLINGEPVLLKGGCLHHDNGFLGSKSIRRAERRKAETMKKNGYNAIRSSHNPPSKYLLEACDELGILVIDEFFDVWTRHKAATDYSQFFSDNWEKDLTNAILRDRNHPSIIMWSIGNEIMKVDVEEGLRLGSALRDKVKTFDTTRPVTEAIPNFMLHGGWAGTEPFFALLDVCGYNYMQKAYATDIAKYPDRIIYGSETYPGEIYENWYAAEHYTNVLGGFVWTAMDYIGEVAVGKSEYVKEIPVLDWDAFADVDKLTPKLVAQLMGKRAESTWPQFIAWCGDIDIIGEKKPQSYYVDVVWDNSAVEMNVHEPTPEGLVEDVSRWGWPREYPSWNWDGCEGKLLQVRVFTKAPQVRLELDGELMGEKSLTESDKYIATFLVPYKPGKLTAIALSDGKEVGRKTLATTGKPVSLKLSVDRSRIAADRHDLSYVRVDAVDADGALVPVSDILVTISVTGDGELAASGNADPKDMASVNRSAVRLYRGQAQAIVRPFGNPGRVNITVTADGLASSAAEITVE